MLLTSRVSVEMVQKAAAIDASVIVAVSAPTALAVRTAQAAGITLAAIARDDGFEVFDPSAPDHDRRNRRDRRPDRSAMSPDKLVYMANQIGKFFASQRADQAVAGITDHLQKYWDPRMRATILEHLANGGQGLDPLAREAVERLGKGGCEDSKPASG